MTKRIRHTVTLGPAAALAAFVLLGAPAAGADTLAPLPSSDYSVRPVCSEPARGDAACLAMELVPQTAAARAHTHPLGITLQTAGRSASEPCETPTAAEGCLGLRPEDLHSAYELPKEAPTSQTIALVDAYNDPTAEADLKAYDVEFGLPECTSGNGCFEQVNQSGNPGEPPFPKTSKELEEHEAAGTSTPEERKEAEEAEGWTEEISLDIETAHAVCQKECKILLVEANSPSLADLEAAEETAVAKGANEVSNSWGGPECVEERDLLECFTDSAAFDHPGVVITAAAGDTGYRDWASSDPGYADFPASSPQVVAVGGTRLTLDAEGKRTAERVWNDAGKSDGEIDGFGASGGGCSKQFEAQPWQQQLSDWPGVGCVTRRAVADVAADADPHSGLAVRDSSNKRCDTEGVPHWCTVGGTSLASPLIAAVFALAGGAHGVSYPAQTLYANQGSFYDVTTGSNGECDQPFSESSACSSAEEAAASCHSYRICLAGKGYDGPTGVGTPEGVTGFAPPAGGDGEETGFAGAGKEASSKSSESSSASESSALPPPPPPNGASVTPVGGSSTSSAGSASTSVETISALGLTRKAIKALDVSRPRISQLGFKFTSSRPTIVHVSLQRFVVEHRRARWQAQAAGLEIAVSGGPNTQAFGGHEVLRGGTYRLTVTPVEGTARTIEFEIG